MRGEFVIARGTEADDPTDIDIEDTAYIPNEVGTHELFRFAWGANRLGIVSIEVIDA